jgi:hypothetical protein
MRAASLCGAAGLAFLAACEARTIAAVSIDASPPPEEIASVDQRPTPWVDASLPPEDGPSTSYNPYSAEDDAALPIVLDANVSTDAADDVDAAIPVPPAHTCDADFPDGEEPCPLPPAVCADALRLVIYQGGLCVFGSCMWPHWVIRCSGGCMNGACVPPLTR